MLYIKSYKLFESKEEKSMIDKIKSYSYIFQDEGFDAIYYAKAYTKIDGIPLESDLVTKRIGNSWEYEEIEQPPDNNVISFFIQLAMIHDEDRLPWDKELVRIFNNRIEQIATEFQLIFPEYEVKRDSMKVVPHICFTKKQKMI